MKKKVEFIESYIREKCGDYIWCDNHGELVRCGDCKHRTTKRCPNWLNSQLIKSDDYCSWGERWEDDD